MTEAPGMQQRAGIFEEILCNRPLTIMIALFVLAAFGTLGVMGYMESQSIASVNSQ